MTLRALCCIASLLLPACAGSRSATSPTTTSVAPPTPAVATHVEPLAAVDAGRVRAHSVVVWEHYLGWTAAPSAHADPDRVFVHDLHTDTTRVVARTSYPGGTIPRLRASKDSIVYLDMSRVATPDDGATNWRLYEVSVKSGKIRQLLASATRAERVDPPLPSVSWPWVAWLHPTEKDLSVQSLDLRDGSRRTLVPSTSGSQLSFDDVSGTIFYDDDNGAGGRDLFRLAPDGSQPAVQVTSSGAVDFPIARNGGVVWQEPVGSSSDSLWYLPTAGTVTSPTRFSTPDEVDAPLAGTNGFPGRGFVVWLVGDRLLARDAEARSRPASLQERDVSIPARWWVDADRVAWATLTGIGTATEKSVVHLAKITVADERSGRG